jgi:hypothetical protein
MQVGDLSSWAELEGQRLVADIPDPAAISTGEVALATWQQWFPPSRAASADAFARLIAAQQPWLLEIEPRLADVAWLEGPRRRS